MDGGILERKKIPVQKLWSGVIFSRDCGNCKSKSQQHHKGHGLPLVHSFKAILYDCSFGTVQASIALVMFTSHGLLLKAVLSYITLSQCCSTFCSIGLKLTSACAAGTSTALSTTG